MPEPQAPVALVFFDTFSYVQGEKLQQSSRGDIFVLRNSLEKREIGGQVAIRSQLGQQIVIKSPQQMHAQAVMRLASQQLIQKLQNTGNEGEDFQGHLYKDELYGTEQR